MLGRHDEAEAALSEAQALATTDRERALAALARSSNLFRGLGRAADAEAVIVEAALAVADGDLRDELRAAGDPLVVRGPLPRELGAHRSVARPCR